MDGPLPVGLVEELERVLREDSDPPGRDLYPAVFASGLLFPLQRCAETAAMMRIAREVAPRTVAEIGTDKAGSALSWIKSLSPERFIGIEYRGVPYAETFQRAYPKTAQLWIGASSYAETTVAEVRDWLGDEPIDVLFIDGDKARFLSDFEAYLPMVREGGIVFMHDVVDPSPSIAWKEARKHPRVRDSFVIRDVSEVEAALAREAAGEPPASNHERWIRHWRGASCTVGVMRL